MDLDQAESNYFTRGQGGKIRFNKTNRRSAQGKHEDMEMAGPIHSKLKEKKQGKVIRQEYRTKKAGGDVKKKGRVDPYACVPLTSLRKGPKDGLSLTNKSKADKRKNGNPGRRS